MRKYEDLSGVPQSAPQYICSTAEFEQETKAPDGASLVVVNESTHAVDNYYIAYKGYWNTL